MCKIRGLGLPDICLSATYGSPLLPLRSSQQIHRSHGGKGSVERTEKDQTGLKYLNYNEKLFL